MGYTAILSALVVVVGSASAASEETEALPALRAETEAARLVLAKDLAEARGTALTREG